MRPPDEDEPSTFKSSRRTIHTFSCWLRLPHTGNAGWDPAKSRARERHRTLSRSRQLLSGRYRGLLRHERKEPPRVIDSNLVQRRLVDAGLTQLRSHDGIRSRVARNTS